MIDVLFFGPVTAHVDNSELQLEYQQSWCLGDVVDHLRTRFPQAFEVICFIAVNQIQTSDLQQRLSDRDEIAFMAKFSGG